jgi:hypothetical protein
VLTFLLLCAHLDAAAAGYGAEVQVYVPDFIEKCVPTLLLLFLGIVAAAAAAG